MRKRESFNFMFFMIFFLFLFSIPDVLAVGISHGDTIINFVPNLEKRISFEIKSIKPGTILNISVIGDLKDYVNLTDITDESFIAIVSLPDKIEKPGTHTILVRIEEIPNVTEGTIGSVTAVQIPILIKVPYPEKYVEISLDVPNVNAGELINFEISVTNLGRQDITSAKGTIEIYNVTDEKIATIYTDEKPIKTSVTEKLYAQWKTDKEGKYKAVAIVNYDRRIAETEETFRVGTLLIKIINCTKKFQEDTLNPFDIRIKSEWNGKISNVYAQIIISSEDKVQVASLKTPSMDINLPKERTITTYWDTKGLDTGSYNANITLYYANETTEKIVEVQIVRKFNKILLSTLACIIIAIGIMFTFWYLKKRKKRRKKKKRKG